MPAHTTASAQHLPAHMFEPTRQGTASQSPTLGPPHLVHRLVQMHRDMEPIQHMQGLAGFGRNHIEVRLPHIAAYKTQSADDFLSQRCQTSAQGGLGSLAPHPQQPPAMAVDLIDHCQKAVGAGPPATTNAAPSGTRPPSSPG